jgi:hypothetical protein
MLEKLADIANLNKEQVESYERQWMSLYVDYRSFWKPNWNQAFPVYIAITVWTCPVCVQTERLQALEARDFEGVLCEFITIENEMLDDVLGVDHKRWQGPKLKNYPAISPLLPSIRDTCGVTDQWRWGYFKLWRLCSIAT